MPLLSLAADIADDDDGDTPPSLFPATPPPLAAVADVTDDDAETPPTAATAAVVDDDDATDVPDADADTRPFGASGGSCSMHAALLLMDAYDSAVFPAVSRRLTSAPRCNSFATRSALPFSHANISAVLCDLVVSCGWQEGGG